MMRIETVAFSEKEFESARPRLSQRLANRPRRIKLGGRAPIVRTLGVISNRVPFLPERHLGIEVRQVIESARAPHSQPALGVQ